MALAEDFSAFFNVDEFAVAALYNGTTTVNGILDLAYIEPLGGIVQGTAPAFTCPESAVPAAKHGDTLAASGRSYKVVGVEPDGTGIVVLRLERQ